jgi:hypothetical protein
MEPKRVAGVHLGFSRDSPTFKYGAYYWDLRLRSKNKWRWEVREIATKDCVFVEAVMVADLDHLK